MAVTTDEQLKQVGDNNRKRAGIVGPKKLGSTVDESWGEPARVAQERCARHEAYEVEQRRREEQERRKALLRAADLPMRHMRQCGELERSDPWTTVYASILSRIEDGFLVVLIGGRGTGKTQMAVELAMQVIGQDQSVLYTTVQEMFFVIRSGFKDGNTELDGLQRLTAPSFLVIDEVCTRGDTPFENRILDLLIDCRYRDMRDTILCANETDDGTDVSPLRESFGRSIVSRMAETGLVVRCEWPSFRSELA